MVFTASGPRELESCDDGEAEGFRWLHLNLADHRTRLWIDALGFSLFFLPVTLYLTWLSVPFAQQSVVSQEHSSAGAQPLG